MENIMSMVEDVVYIGKELKNKLRFRISINEIGLYQEVLHGSFLKDNTVFKFYVKCNKNHFMRIQLDHNDGTIEEQTEAMLELIDELSNIVLNGKKNSKPLVIYLTKLGSKLCINADWAFQNKDEYLKSIVDGSMFDDGSVVKVVRNFQYNEECCANCNWSYSQEDEILSQDECVMFDDDIISHVGDCCLSVPLEERVENGYYCKSYEPTLEYKLLFKKN